MFFDQTIHPIFLHTSLFILHTNLFVLVPIRCDWKAVRACLENLPSESVQAADRCQFLSIVMASDVSDGTFEMLPVTPVDHCHPDQLPRNRDKHKSAEEHYAELVEILLTSACQGAVVLTVPPEPQLSKYQTRLGARRPSPVNIDLTEDVANDDDGAGLTPEICSPVDHCHPDQLLRNSKSACTLQTELMMVFKEAVASGSVVEVSDASLTAASQTSAFPRDGPEASICATSSGLGTQSASEEVSDLTGQDAAAGVRSIPVFGRASCVGSTPSPSLGAAQPPAMSPWHAGNCDRNELQACTRGTSGCADALGCWRVSTPLYARNRRQYNTRIGRMMQQEAAEDGQQPAAQAQAGFTHQATPRPHQMEREKVKSLRLRPLPPRLQPRSPRLLRHLRDSRPSAGARPKTMMRQVRLGGRGARATSSLAAADDTRAPPNRRSQPQVDASLALLQPLPPAPRPCASAAAPGGEKSAKRARGPATGPSLRCVVPQRPLGGRWLKDEGDRHDREAASSSDAPPPAWSTLAAASERVLPRPPSAGKPETGQRLRPCASPALVACQRYARQRYAGGGCGGEDSRLEHAALSPGTPLGLRLLPLL